MRSKGLRDQNNATLQAFQPHSIPAFKPAFEFRAFVVNVFFFSFPINLDLRFDPTGVSG